MSWENFNIEKNLIITNKMKLAVEFIEETFEDDLEIRCKDKNDYYCVSRFLEQYLDSAKIIRKLGE